MKKIIIPFLVLILAASVALAADPKNASESEPGQGNSEPAQQDEDADKKQDVKTEESEDQDADEGEEVQTEEATQNQGEDQNLMIEEKVKLKAGDKDELKQMIQERKQEMDQEAQSLGENQKKVYQNQNEVRLAVHSLLAMEDLVGGIGQQVSQIAREFDNSVQSTIKAEEKIQTKNHFIKFFTGGDDESAGLIEQEVNRNQERIEQLKELLAECDCDEELKEIIQEQIVNIEQEQNRLQQLAESEQEYKGLFDWLFGWLRG